MDFLNAIFCSTKKELLRAERVCRADREAFQDLFNLGLRGCERVEEGFPYSLHGSWNKADSELWE